MADIAPQGMGEAECDVRLVAVHDHRDEQAVQRVPNPRVVRESGECGAQPRPVLLDVAAVQSKAFLADPYRGMWIHGLEGALGAVRVLAQQAVKVVENRQNEPGGRGNPPSVIGASGEAGIGPLDLGIAPRGRGLQPLLIHWLHSPARLSALSYTGAWREPARPAGRADCRRISLPGCWSKSTC